MLQPLRTLRTKRSFAWDEIDDKSHREGMAMISLRQQIVKYNLGRRTTKERQKLHYSPANGLGNKIVRSRSKQVFKHEEMCDTI